MGFSACAQEILHPQPALALSFHPPPRSLSHPLTPPLPLSACRRCQTFQDIKHVVQTIRFTHLSLSLSLSVCLYLSLSHTHTHTHLHTHRITAANSTVSFSFISVGICFKVVFFLSAVVVAAVSATH